MFMMFQISIQLIENKEICRKINGKVLFCRFCNIFLKNFHFQKLVDKVVNLTDYQIFNS